MSPNSFYEPHLSIDHVLNTAKTMIAHGADILDIGGEATNPYVDIKQEAPTYQQEIERVVPTIMAIKERFDILVSVDTSQPQVMRAAVTAGADIINDQRALASPLALQAAVDLQIPVCLMHFFTSPRQPASTDKKTLLMQVKQDLLRTVERCYKAGILKHNIIIDPGFGQGNYAKNCQENFYLLSHLEAFIELGFPVLVGWSRKSMIGDVLNGAPPAERLYGSIAAATLAANKGAAIIRVHDVKATYDAIQVVKHYQAACLY